MDRKRTQIGLAPPVDEARPSSRFAVVPVKTLSIGNARSDQRSAQRTERSRGGTMLGLAPPKLERAPDDGGAESGSPGAAAPPTMRPHAQGTRDRGPVLGRYEVLGRIARGGMGVVYLCRVTGKGGFRRLFALKVLQKSLSRDPAAARMFLHEARVAARIYDPHVVGIVDVGVHGTQPYLVMDYVEGGSFHELLERHPDHRPPRLIVPIVLDALGGLAAAHGLTGENGEPAGIVHSDVSPHNMLVGIDGHCRLSDFGIARAGANVTTGRADVLYGKPAYLSPEQANRQPDDHRSDLFSLGVVLWNALTGERLFDGGSQQEILSKVRAARAPAPSTARLHPPACLDAVCLKALARDPAARYQSAEEMARDLRTTAMHANLLAPASEVAAWIKETFGAELSARRLAALGGSGAEPANSDPEPAQAADRLPLANARRRAMSRSNDAARTVVLISERDKNRRAVVYSAALVIVVAILAAVLWPDRVARIFGADGAAVQPSTSGTDPPVTSGESVVPARR